MIANPSEFPQPDSFESTDVDHTAEQACESSSLIKLELDVEDYVAFQVYVYWNSIFFRYMQRALVVTSTSAICLLVLQYTPGEKIPPHLLGLFGLSAVIASWIYLLPLYYVLHPAERYKQATGPQELEMSKNGLTNRIKGLQKFFGWSTDWKVVERKKHWFIYVSPRQAFVISKTKILSGNLHLFIQSVRARITKR